jgi:hypothetical protein
MRQEFSQERSNCTRVKSLVVFWPVRLMLLTSMLLAIKPVIENQSKAVRISRCIIRDLRMSIILVYPTYLLFVTEKGQKNVRIRKKPLPLLKAFQLQAVVVLQIFVQGGNHLSDSLQLAQIKVG